MLIYIVYDCGSTVVRGVFDTVEGAQEFVNKGISATSPII
jgi:hypothetical protein